LQGVTYLSLNGIPSAERLPEALVQALDLILPDQGDLLDQLCHYLAAKEMLIVLDNFEHLLEPHEHRNPTNQHNYIPNRARSQINVGCQILSQILQAAPHVKFLITSRQPLRLQQEYRYPLIGMTPPAVQTNSAISELRTFDAVCLFEQVALQHNRTFEITNDNADAICQFCTMVEGIPLAIMLGAIHMGFLTPQELVAECQESLDVLETEWADLPDRQRSVRAIFEYTWGLLDDASQQIFQKLTVFRGGFNRRAAREVAGASIPQLRRLHAQSLVKLVGKDRYELHELLRQFGAEKLAALNATTDVQSKHMAYYLQWVCTQTDVLDGDKPHIATAMIVPDLENIRQAWTHGLSPLLASPSLGEGQIHHGITALGLGEGLFEHKALPLLSQSLTAIARFYEIKGFHQAGLDILTQAVEMCQAPLADTMPTVVPDAASGTTFSMVETVSPLVEFYSDLLVTQGFFYNQLGQFTEAIQTAETAIGYVYSNQDRLYSAIYTVWGTGLLNQGAFQQAQTKAEQALDHAQQLNSTLLMADSLYLRGYIQFMVNDYDAAITDLRAAHTHYLRIQNRRKEIECVKVLGKVHAWMGQLAVAKRHFEQAIQFSQTIQNELQQQSLTFDLCRTAINMGAYEEAAQQGQSALDFFQHIGNRSMMAILHYHLGVIYMRVGLYDDAYAQLEQALALCRVMSARDKQVNCLVNLAVIASNLDDHEKALLLLQEAEQRSEALEMAYLQGYVHRFMAQAMSQLGEFQQSITLYQSALALYPAELDYQRIEIKAGLVHALHQVGEHDTIDAHLEDVLFYLEQNRDKLYLMINPIAVYLICYQVLNAWQDTRASAIFDAGYTLLQSYADRIQHADWRHSFLENVATNQQLLSINQLKKGNQS
ncbi:MAG: tetratricopeptide repeat protein, partial [Chloroflexota bacterium]